jgi:hypothetical protein
MRNLWTTIAVLSTNDYVIRTVSYREALRMIESGTAVDATQRRHGKPPVFRIRLKELERLKRSDPPTITCGEMEANVGALGGRGFQHKSQEKVEAWPFVGDEQSVRVGPLGVSLPTLVSPELMEAYRARIAF